MSRLIWLIALALTTVATAAHQTQEVDGVSAYRGLDGAWTSQSRRNLLTLESSAQRYGRIVVWIAFDMAFTGNPELRTDEVIATEVAIKQELVESVLRPIVASGHAEMVAQPTQTVGAPGCLVSISKMGLKLLSRSPSVKYIGYIAF